MPNRSLFIGYANGWGLGDLRRDPRVAWRRKSRLKSRERDVRDCSSVSIGDRC